MENLLKQWSDLSKEAVESVRKLADINTDLMMNLTQQQMDMVAIYIDSGNKQAQALNQAKQLPEILASQSQLSEDFNKKVLNNVRVTVEMLTEAKEQLTEIISKQTLLKG